MNEVLKCLKERRSIRKYKNQQITDQELEQILEAGMYAPTALGLQSPIMVVVQDPKTIHSNFLPYNYKIFIISQYM